MENPNTSVAVPGLRKPGKTSLLALRAFNDLSNEWCDRWWQNNKVNVIVIGLLGGSVGISVGVSLLAMRFPIVDGFLTWMVWTGISTLVYGFLRTAGEELYRNIKLKLNTVANRMSEIQRRSL